MSFELILLFNPTGQLLARSQVSLSTYQVVVLAVNPIPGTVSSNFQLDKNVAVTSLSWASLSSLTNSSESEVVLVGASNGKVYVYSPFNNNLICTLESALYNDQITCVQYKNDSIWTADVKNNVIEWDLLSFSPRTVLLNPLEKSESASNEEIIELVQPFNNSSQLLICTHKVYLYDIQKNTIVQEISNYASPISQALFVADEKWLVTCAKNDRFINIYQVTNGQFVPSRVLVTQSNVESFSFGKSGAASLLSVVTETGVCELFYSPLESPANGELTGSGLSNGSARRRKRKSTNNLTKNSDGLILLKRPEGAESLAVLTTLVLGNQLIVSWIENSVASCFDQLEWYNVSSLETTLTGKVELAKERLVQKLASHTMRGHDVAASGLYNENNVHLSVGDNFRDLDEDEEMTSKYDISQDIEEEDPDETLGDKLFAIDPNAKAIRKTVSSLILEVDRVKSAKPTTGSLTVLLTQALKSNDGTLLESVLSSKEESTIQNTIQNLNPELSMLLLQKLSEKYNFISSVSASSLSYQKQIQLNYWIKWILILHGSFLKVKEINNSGNRQLLKNLSLLLINLNKKSSQLPKLMLLQTKLNTMFEKTNYKNELLNDFDNLRPVKSKSNRITRYGSEKLDEEEFESDVEYNEELDDGLLIEDGEALSSDEDEDLEVEINGVDDFDEMEEDFGDVEVGIAPDQDMEVDSDEESANQYEEKVKALKQKAVANGKAK